MAMFVDLLMSFTCNMFVEEATVMLSLSYVAVTFLEFPRMYNVNMFAGAA